MACVTGSCDQSLRRGDMEGVRFDLEIVGNAGRGNLHRIEQLVKNTFRTLLSHGDWRDGVLIPFDDTEIFQLPAEHHLQGSVMQRSQIDGEPQGVSRCFRSVDADHNRTLASWQRGTRQVVCHGVLRGRKCIGDGILHAGLLIVENAHHGDRNFRSLGERSRKRSEEPARHTAKGTAPYHNLLRVPAYLQQRGCSRGLDRC